MPDSPASKLRSLLVDGLRARGEPLFLSGPRAVPAAAIYAALQQARRRTTIADRRAGCAIDGLTRQLAQLWEGRDPARGGASAWLPAERLCVATLVERCEALKAVPRRDQLDVRDLADLEPEDLLASLLFGARIVHDGTVAPGWDTLGQPAPTPRS